MVELDKDTFDANVLESKELVIVDYFSDSCEPCKALMPYVEELEEEFAGKVKFYKYNTAKGRRLAIREKILGLPTISLYNEGGKITEVTKENATAENIRKMIEAAIK